jgi:hypothetical protein
VEIIIFFWRDLFFLVTVKERKEVGRGGESLQKQGTGTETYGNRTCFPMFLKHVPGTLKKNLLLHDFTFFTL